MPVCLELQVVACACQCVWNCKWSHALARVQAGYPHAGRQQLRPQPPKQKQHASFAAPLHLKPEAHLHVGITRVGTGGIGNKHTNGAATQAGQSRAPHAATPLALLPRMAAAAASSPPQAMLHKSPEHAPVPARSSLCRHTRRQQVSAPAAGPVHAPAAGPVHTPAVGPGHVPAAGSVPAPAACLVHAPAAGPAHTPVAGPFRTATVGPLHACGPALWLDHRKAWTCRPV
eukprot:363584-Chlamydomonas_euryale.AAC.4